MTPEALLARHGIHLECTAPGRHYTTCPKCSAGRRQQNQKEKVLGVTIDGKGARWGCNHCGWTGPEKGTGANNGRQQRPAATYDYHAASGELIFQKVRNPPGHAPRFWCRRPDGKGGWISNTKGIDKKPLYREPEVVEAIKAARTICIVEGEKDADSLWRLDLPATCNFDGAADVTKSPNAKPKWKPEYSERLRDASIVVFNDNDPQGIAHADAACRLSHGITNRVRRLDLAPHWPGMPKGADVSDWLAVGGEHTPERLRELIEAAPDYVPADPAATKPGPQQTNNGDDAVDPLEGLAEKAAADPGAPFMPEVLEALAALKKDDRAAFEALRVDLKRAGCRVTALDDAIAEETGEGGRGPSQADILLELAQAAALFQAPDSTGFADLDVNGHRETWPIRSKGFKRWLARRFYEETGGAPNSEALAATLNVIEAKAHFDAPERVVHVRVGGADGKLYLDLCDTGWRAIEVDASGWRVIDSPPVRFRRSAGMLPLPLPVAGGEIEDLRPFLNVKKPDEGMPDHDFILAVAWIVAALRDCGPYPALALAGEHGTAKSTFARVLRSLIDPSSSPLRALPREDRDLFIAANNGHVLSFDNVSGLPAWISDTLCRLSTGGGFATRTLYTDQDETLFDGVRPVILNGIEEVITRPDLADRTIFLTLEAIPQKDRRPEKALLAAFEAKRPQILGALLDAAVEGLWRLPNTRLETLPRMADFAFWITACEGALWEHGTFAAAYQGNRDDAVESVIEADPVATALRGFMAGRNEWAGKAADLLRALGEAAGEKITKAKIWPDSPRALSGRLRRAAPFLRKVGIKIDFAREPKAARTRLITITFSEVDGMDAADADPSGRPWALSVVAGASAASAETPPFSGLENGGDFASTSSTSSTPNDSNDLQRTVEWTVGPHDTPTVHPTVHANPLKDKAVDGVDGADAKIPPQSEAKKTGWSTRL